MHGWIDAKLSEKPKSVDVETPCVIDTPNVPVIIRHPLCPSRGVIMRLVDPTRSSDGIPSPSDTPTCSEVIDIGRQPSTKKGLVEIIASFMVPANEESQDGCAQLTRVISMKVSQLFVFSGNCQTVQVGSVSKCLNVSAEEKE